MKAIRLNPFLNNVIARVSGPMFYSAQPLTDSSSSSASSNSLYSQIWRAGDPRSSTVPLLDKWIEQGRRVTRADLQQIIKKLRHYRRYRQALEVSEWMRDRMNHELSPGDIAVQLDLVSKVRGLDEAERYFANIPDSSRVLQVYGALLNCYAGHKSLEKAEATMQRMRESGYLIKALPYNVMLNLYSRMGEFDKLETLLQEIEEKGIPRDHIIGQRRSKRKKGTNNSGIRKNIEPKATRKLMKSVFCPACQGTGMHNEGDENELEKITYPLSEIFKIKIKVSDARRSWMKSPEVLNNCSIGFHFSSQSEEIVQEKVKPIKLLQFYHAEV